MSAASDNVEVLDGAILENFIRAFHSGGGGCRRQCECGREFYNSDGGWTWNEGELERLEASAATDLDHTVETLVVEGREYCIDCTCWHVRASHLARWISNHGRGIAHFLTLEKRRLEEKAANAPVVVVAEVPPGDDWKPILTAPRNCTHLRVMMWDGTIHEDAHWASDFSGDEQPPFDGWFVPVNDSSGKVTSYSGIKTPKWWALSKVES